MFLVSKHLPNPHDPRKDPAWRWLRCGYLLEHDRQPLSRDDDATRETWLFRRALGRCRAEEDREWLARDFPALADAHRLFTTDEPLSKVRSLAKRSMPRAASYLPCFMRSLKMAMTPEYGLLASWRGPKTLKKRSRTVSRPKTEVKATQ